MSFFAALNTVGELTGWMAQCLRPFAIGFEQAGVEVASPACSKPKRAAMW